MYFKNFKRSNWHFSGEPFPAFRCDLVFGRNKRDFGMLPVKGGIKPDENGEIPPHSFRVIKTREKGTILIVPGSDNTDRLLLFCGEAEGFRGSICYNTTGDIQVLKNVHACNACDGFKGIAAIMSPGSEIVFHVTGRRTDDAVVYRYEGAGEVSRQVMRWEEHQAQKEMAEIGADCADSPSCAETL